MKPETKPKTKTIPKYNPEGPITAFQKKEILKNCQFNMDIKDEWVQWATADINKTSLKSITQEQAVKIIRQQTGRPHPQPLSRGEGSEEAWGYFDKDNNQHRYITVLLRNANIVVKSNKWGEVADMEGWFNDFLHSCRSPVRKPLKSMTVAEVSKIITALEGVAVWKNSIYKI